MTRSTILAVALLLTLLLGFAPAPLLRRTKAEPSPTLPLACVMRWHGVSFRPDGSYRAVGFGGLAVWVGRWRLDGLTLTIDESLTPEVLSSGRRYEVTLAVGLRTGRFAGDEAGASNFIIEPITLDQGSAHE